MSSFSFPDIEGIEYSSELCKNHHVFDMVFKACNCSLESAFSELETNRKEKKDSWNFCSVKKSTINQPSINTDIPIILNLIKVLGKDKYCLTETFGLIGQGVSPEQLCPPACSEKSYETSISALKWPSAQYWSDLAKLANVTYKGMFSLSDLSTLARPLLHK